MGAEIFSTVTCSVHTRIYDKAGDIDAPFAEIAKKHLELVSSDDMCPGYVRFFLEAVVEGRCVFGGSKGDALSYASGCQDDAETILQWLKPWFLEMWQRRVIPHYHGAIITSNYESVAQTNVIELRLSDDAKDRVRRGREITEEDLSIRNFVGDWYTLFDN